jgi:hypothetical protein
MPIPGFNQLGLLPEGTHDCTFQETERRFGTFQGSDRRNQLWARFKEFFDQAKATGLIQELLLDGSFVTSELQPNDIDLVVVVSREHDFGADLTPGEYNVLSKQRVRRRFGFDIVLAIAGTDEVDETADFFRQVRGRPNIRKGLLRIRL